IAAWLLLPPAIDPDRVSRRLWLVPILAPALYATLQELHSTWYGNPERDLARLLAPLGDIPVTLTMFFHMIASGVAGLVLGPFYSPATYPNPLAYVTLALYAVGVGAMLATRRPTARPLTAVLLLATGSYAIVAAARATLALLFRVPLGTAGAIPRYQY